MKNKQSLKFLQQKKMLLVLPALVIPFITLAFWALGGGKGTAQNDQNKYLGLNLELPDANIPEDKNADKLSFYKEADNDSLKKEEMLRNDPYYQDKSSPIDNTLVSAGEDRYHIESPFGAMNSSPNNVNPDKNEQRIYQKINEINKQINQPANGQGRVTHHQPLYPENEQFSGDVSSLKGMMQLMNDKQEADPEMQEINKTLDKVLDIQHPERIKEKLREKSIKNKEQVFILSNPTKANNVGLIMGKKNSSTANRFYSLEEDTVSDEQNSVDAMISQTQTIANGSVVKLRLLNDIYINEVTIPKGNYVYGIAQLKGERLEISIQSIRYNKSLFPVNLEIFDMDGLPGLNIPGAISRDVAKQSGDNALQLLELTSLDPSFKAQAAATGINAAKSFLSRRVKQVKVVVKAGYRVLLRDKSVEQ